MIKIQNDLVLKHKNKYKSRIEIVIPYNYIQIYLNEHINKDDTLEMIARKYYDKDSYSKVYSNIENYIDIICKINDINKNNLTPFQDLKIPVLIHKENVYLEQINNCEKEIDKLEYWVEYIVQDGDTLSSLAYLGAGNSTEALSNIEKIKVYNKLNSNEISTNQKLYIINPEIGKLKQDIAFLKHQLKESLIINEKKN